MQRRYDIDWVRDITVLSIIFFHSLIIFFTRESAVMYVRAGVDLPFCYYMEAFMGRFCMPLLFLLAGFSLYKSLERRTAKQVYANRFRKLLIPLLIGSLFLNPIASYIYGLTQGRDISYGKNWLLFVTTLSKDLEARTTGYGPMHLWFLLFLLIFSIVSIPFLKKCFNEKNSKTLQRLATFLCKPYVLLLLVIPYPLFFLVDILDEMNPFAYFYVFLFGFLYATNDQYQQALDRDRLGYTLLSIITVSLSLYNYFIYQGPENLGLELCTKLCRMLVPMTILGWAHVAIPNKESKVLTYLNKANFPIYIYHMAVLTLVGYLVLKLSLPSWVQFILINIIAYGACFLLFEGYQRIRSWGKKLVKN